MVSLAGIHCIIFTLLLSELNFAGSTQCHNCFEHTCRDPNHEHIEVCTKSSDVCVTWRFRKSDPSRKIIAGDVRKRGCANLLVVVEGCIPDGKYERCVCRTEQCNDKTFATIPTTTRAPTTTRTTTPTTTPTTTQNNAKKLTNPPSTTGNPTIKTTTAVPVTPPMGRALPMTTVKGKSTTTMLPTPPTVQQPQGLFPEGTTEHARGRKGKKAWIFFAFSTSTYETDEDTTSYAVTSQKSTVPILSATLNTILTMKAARTTETASTVETLPTLPLKTTVSMALDAMTTFPSETTSTLALKETSTPKLTSTLGPKSPPKLANQFWWNTMTLQPEPIWVPERVSPMELDSKTFETEMPSFMELELASLGPVGLSSTLPLTEPPLLLESSESSTQRSLPSTESITASYIAQMPDLATLELPKTTTPKRLPKKKVKQRKLSPERERLTIMFPMSTSLYDDWRR